MAESVKVTGTRARELLLAVFRGPASLTWIVSGVGGGEEWGGLAMFLM